MATPLRSNGSAATQQSPPAQPKLGLRVQKGRIAHPVWVHVHGETGLGKTTFANGAPKPLFIDVEQGSFNVDAARFVFDEATGRTRPNTFEEFMEAMRVVEREGFPTYETLTIDTLDALEALVWEFICRRDSKVNISAYGFMKGEKVVALDEWRKIVASIERVRARGMNVVTISHTQDKKRDDPDGEGWNRYILQLDPTAAGLIKARSDAVLFARREVARVKDAATGKTKGIDTEQRLLYTTWDTRWDAKNRYDLPESLALDWNELAAAIAAHKPGDPAKLVESIKRDAKRVGGDVEKTALACVAADGDDAVKMTKVRTWLTTKLAEAGVTEEA